MSAPGIKESTATIPKHGSDDSLKGSKNEPIVAEIESIDSQLSSKLELLKANPLKVISPATHLLRRATSGRSRKNNEGDDKESKMTSNIDGTASSSLSDEDTPDPINKSVLPPNAKHSSYTSMVDFRDSRFKLPSSSLVTSSARKLTVSSHNALQRTLSPIKYGVSSVENSVSNITRPKSEEPSLSSADRAQHITRSFASYITAASVFAGFKELEVEGMDESSLSFSRFDSDDTNVIAPDDVVKINDSETDESNTSASDYEDAPGNFNETGMEDYSSIVTKSTISNTGETIKPIYQNGEDSLKNASLNYDLTGNSSKFELSVVQKLMDKATTVVQREAVAKKASIVTKRLKEVFSIDESQDFLGDYPCWLMGDVLLQGHLYVTNKNILFFAYLPKKKKNTIVKSGSMSIKSYPSMRMHRKWLVLRENTLSVYSSSTDLYFPQLVIDLRTALRAETYGSSKDTNPTTPIWVSIVTENKTFWYQAENLDCAKSWVTALKKQIFSSRNKGDEFAIEIPLQNIIDLEISSVFATTKSLRIKIIENPETFAIDDYFVMFFSQGNDAAECIKEAIDNAGVQISHTPESGKEDWKNSDLLKSKIELLKNTSSTVRSTNFHHIKEDELIDAREVLSSSGDESDDDDFGPTAFIRKVRTSTGKKLTKNLMPHIKIKRSTSASSSKDDPRSVDSVLDLTKSSPKDYISDPSTAKRNTISSTENSDNDEEEDSDKKWTARSFAHGITSFTSSLIFSGPPQHFDDTLTISQEGQDPYFVKEKKKRKAAQNRYVKRFSLAEGEKLLATYQLYLMKGLPTYGKLYIGSNHVCFRSTLPGTNTVMILPISDIENVSEESGFRFGYCGLVLVIRGHEELFFEFSNNNTRDDCEVRLLKKLEEFKSSNFQLAANIETSSSREDETLNSAKLKMFENKINSDIGINVPIIVEDHPLERTHIKPEKSYRFTLLTIGSRGDVQPYIALGKLLMKEGHKVKIVTHMEFKEWVESYNIGFGAIAGDPSALMALMVSNPSINYTFIKEAKAKFRDWIDDLLLSSWSACQDCDVLIESPSSIGGIHIAEKLQIPYFRAFTMPWTRTRAYPHAFLVPDQKLGGAYNYMTHVAFENGYWRGTCYQVNKWRVEVLKLPKTSLGAMHQNSVPFIYNISPIVFPPSIDFPDWVKVSGYWFLDEKNNYEPPEKLKKFMKKARDDGKKLVYIGFGSIVVEDPKALTKIVVEAVLNADVRCILNKGWSDRLGIADKNKVEMQLPPEIYNSGNIPHDWLFTQLDAAVHHGGSGTTGASLRFGLPTVIKPFFGDQKFYASRVEDMGVGVALKDLDSKSLSKALKEVTTNTRIIDKAKSVGKLIMKENGVQSAVDSIYTLMEYARNLSISKNKNELADEEEDSFSLELPKMDGSWLLV